MKDAEIILILHNIRSVYNTGALFRTAEVAGVKKIYLTGYTADPIDRFGRERKDFHKSALGAELSLEWEHRYAVSRLINELRAGGFQIIALEQSRKSIDYKKVKLRRGAVIILGNEVKGLSKNILDKADIVAEIPVLGKKESLNVSVAAGIFLFRILNI